MSNIKKVKYLKFQSVVNKLGRQLGISRSQVLDALEKNTLEVEAMHPVLNKLMPFKISSIDRATGKITGNFYK